MHHQIPNPTYSPHHQLNYADSRLCISGFDSGYHMLVGNISEEMGGNLRRICIICGLSSNNCLFVGLATHLKYPQANIALEKKGLDDWFPFGWNGFLSLCLIPSCSELGWLLFNFQLECFQGSSDSEILSIFQYSISCNVLSP